MTACTHGISPTLPSNLIASIWQHALLEYHPHFLAIWYHQYDSMHSWNITTLPINLISIWQHALLEYHPHFLAIWYHQYDSMHSWHTTHTSYQFDIINITACTHGISPTLPSNLISSVWQHPPWNITHTSYQFHFNSLDRGTMSV